MYNYNYNIYLELNTNNIIIIKGIKFNIKLCRNTYYLILHFIHKSVI